MNNHQIEALLRGHPRTRRVFKGVFAADTVPVSRVDEAACYVVNLDESDEPGSHWVGIYVCPGKLSEYFDSYGQWCVIPRMVDLLGETYIFNPFQLQSHFTTSCGQHCLFFVLCKSYEKDMRTIVDAYPGAPLENDIFVNKIVERRFATKLEVLNGRFFKKQVSRALSRRKRTWRR